jgi:hypothetical protein
MPRRRAGEGEWDDSSPLEDGDDAEPTVACPYCRQEIHKRQAGSLGREKNGRVRP